ncbi:MAG: diguanylate cyclase [Acidimicrobiales bacterium]|nr:diguanylate cyclase [Acidimicrobiales bacterium]
MPSGAPLWVSSASKLQHVALRRYHWRLHPVLGLVAFLVLALGPLEGSIGALVAVALSFAGCLAIIGFVGQGEASATRLILLVLVDSVLIAILAALYPELWVPLLALQAAVVSMGWLESARVTAILLGTAAMLMGIAGVLAQPEHGLSAFAIFLGLSASVSVTALWSASELPLNAFARSLESVRALVWHANLDGTVSEVIGPVSWLVGVSGEELVGTKIEDVLPAEMRSDWEHQLEELHSIGYTSFVHELNTKSARTVRTSMRLVRVGDEEPQIHGVTVDISNDWLDGEAQRRQASVVKHMTDGLLIVRSDNRPDPVVDQINEPAAAMLGLPETVSWDELERKHAQLSERIAAVLANRIEDHFDYESGEGSTTWARVRVYAVSETLVAAQLSDITSEREAQQLVQHQARHDHLTGLLNAAEFRRQLETRLGQSSLLLVFLLDLDSFKPVNDTYGHAAGDVVLKSVARRLRNSLKSDDSLARLGGDEFVGFAEGLTLAEDAERFRLRLEAACAEPVVVSPDLTVQVSASVGYVIAETTTEVDELIAAADAAMYERKRGKKLRNSVPL